MCFIYGYEAIELFIKPNSRTLSVDSSYYNKKTLIGQHCSPFFIRGEANLWMSIFSYLLFRTNRICSPEFLQIKVKIN